MKVVIIGANGAIGKNIVTALKEKAEVITIGKKSGNYQADIEDQESLKAVFEKIGKFDAVVNASGEVAFAPLADLTEQSWQLGIRSKLLGQINIAQTAAQFLNFGGSITLVSGVLSDSYIQAGVSATTINRAIEGFVQSAANELKNGLRINVVSPTLLEESVEHYGAFFQGFVPVKGSKVAQAFVRSVLGIETGKIYKVE